MPRPASEITDEELPGDERVPQNPVLTPEQALVVVTERPKNLAGVETVLVQSVEEAGKFMTWLGERREVLAVDTETGGFNPWEDPLRLIQIGDAMTGWSIPYQMWGGVAMEALNKYDGQLVFHNVSFDQKFLRIQAGWNPPWHRIHDTMIQAHIIDPTQSVALKNLAVRLVDKRANAGEQLLKEAFAKNKWTWATVPVDYDAYWAYGALDCVLTARLYETLRAHERYPVAYELEMATRRVCTQMEENGSPVDLDYCHRTRDRLSEYVDTIKAWGKDTYGISVGSNVQLAKLLTEKGAVIDKTTASGAMSCDKFVLQKLASDPLGGEVAVIAKTVLAMRKADKLAGTYFSNFIDYAVDGVVHPSINTLGARTARMSIRNPALQTLNKGEATVRNAFIAREGHVLVTADMDQVEARLLAHFTRDPGLIQAFLGEDDFFLTIARRLFQDPELGMKDKRRKLTKNTIYARMYGAGSEKMAQTAGVPQHQMQAIIDNFDAAYPGLKTFQEQIERVGQQRLLEEGVGYVMTPMGRRLPGDEGRLYALVNYIIQSTAAEVLKKAIVNCDLAGLGNYLILPVHDELIMSVPREEAEDAKRVLQACMTVDDGSFAVPLTASAEGPYERWGDSIED